MFTLFALPTGTTKKPPKNFGNGFKITVIFTKKIIGRNIASDVKAKKLILNWKIMNAEIIREQRFQSSAKRIIFLSILLFRKNCLVFMNSTKILWYRSFALTK